MQRNMALISRAISDMCSLGVLGVDRSFKTGFERTETMYGNKGKGVNKERVTRAYPTSIKPSR